MSAVHQAIIAGGLRSPTAVYVDGATGVDSAVLPAHAVGDLIMCFAFCDGADTVPTLGAGFTSDQTNVSGAGAWGARIGYRIATVTNTASGTWTNATSVVFVIYRNAAIGTKTNQGFTTASGNSITYPAFTPSIPNGSSLVIAFAGITMGDTSLQTPPTGMTNRQTVAHAGDEAAAHESSTGRYAWPNTNVVLGGTNGDGAVYIYEIKSV